MGSCMSTEESQEVEERKRSAQIDKMIEEDQKKAQKVCKVLLLGSGESGKSTIVKQMKIIHQNGYSTEELALYRSTIFKNLLESIRGLIDGMKELDLKLEVPENAEYVNYILDFHLDSDPSQILDAKVVKAINSVYHDPVMAQVLDRQTEFYLMDSAIYFLNSLNRIGAIDYLPNETDVLRARIKTTGIFETKFPMNQLTIHMFDVGGQRSERKKWIHCFEGVTLIIFCVALSEYDQVLLEDPGQNRMLESLILFDSVVNSRWFVRSSIVLFLNKVDVFEEKLKKVALSDWFKDYDGGDDFNKAAKFILWRFTQLNRSGLNIYPHLTQATNTSNIRLVFAAVEETILQNSLKDSGIL
ncbi:guanine nucleotide binding protein, alpha subunit [Lipomyces orientalis]|uniref:Guanine nucleotide binding protein, alpha subunit n=1 Tax=Lipomyces orientalis TaxID=1233043 RepID=A0ACC3TLU5_9ASCO